MPGRNPEPLTAKCLMKSCTLAGKMPGEILNSCLLIPEPPSP